MMQLRILIPLSLLLSSGSSSLLLAQNHADASIAVRFGTLGIGLEAAKLLTGHISARVGANYFKLSRTRTQSGITYDATLKAESFSALIDLYPGSRGSFHLTGGIVTDPVKVTAVGQATGGFYKINGNNYTAAQVGTLTGEGKFPSVGPYLGLGFGTPARDGGAIGFLFDLGVVIGKAKITLNATDPLSTPNLQSDLQAQATKTQNDVDKYAKVYPVISFGLSYRF